MKIGIINKFFPPKIGGIEYHARLLAENLSNFSEIEKIEILVANETNTTSIENFNHKTTVKRLANWKTISSTPIAPTFIREIKKMDVDLFHFHFPYPFGDFSWLLAGDQRPYIITYHSDILRQKFLNHFYGPIRDCFFKRARCILASSPQLLENSPVLKKFKNKVEIIPLGICPDKFTSKDIQIRGVQLRKRFSPQPIVLFVGRFVYYKGVEVLIRAFRDIDANLIMIGKGPLESSLMELVKKNGIDEKVFFFSDIDDQELTTFFNICDIFVLPSIATTEAYGLVQLEAHACGKPVISTNLLSGVPFVNEHGKTGLIVEPNDIQGLNKAMKTLVHDQKLREKLGRQAQIRMLREFTDVQMSEKIFKIYKSILY